METGWKRREGKSWRKRESGIRRRRKKRGKEEERIELTAPNAPKWPRANFQVVYQQRSLMLYVWADFAFPHLDLSPTTKQKTVFSSVVLSLVGLALVIYIRLPKYLHRGRHHLFAAAFQHQQSTLDNPFVHKSSNPALTCTIFQVIEIADLTDAVHPHLHFFLSLGY